MNRILKNILECLLGSILVLFFGPLLSPISNPWYQIYTEPLYWVFGILGCSILTSIIIYFVDINPRKFYYCLNIVPISIFLTFSTIGLIISLVFISLVENILLKIILLILLILLYLFLIYVFMHRGICIYKKGKIRIFKFKIKTYVADKIDDINFEYQNRKCLISITIRDYKEEFKLSSLSAKSIENRMKQIVNSNL